jgi:hypothetical protein
LSPPPSTRCCRPYQRQSPPSRRRMTTRMRSHLSQSHRRPSAAAAGHRKLTPGLPHRRWPNRCAALMLRPTQATGPACAAQESTLAGLGRTRTRSRRGWHRGRVPACRRWPSLTRSTRRSVLCDELSRQPMWRGDVLANILPVFPAVV